MRGEAETDQARKIYATASDDAVAIAAREAQPPFILALDIGTSSVRAAFYDARGRNIAGAEARIVRKVFVSVKGDNEEADADALVAEAIRVLIESLTVASAEMRSHVEAISVSCFWHSLVGVGRNKEAITPVFGWADTRAAGEASYLRTQFDESEIHRRTGCRFHASYWPAKLLWLQRNRPDEFRAVARWMSLGELLTLRLCGTTAASVSMASGTGLFDQRKLRWDEELLRALNLSIDQLPPLAADDKTAFTLTKESAQRWPELAAIGAARVFPAIGDGAANNIGAGCVRDDSIALMIGTSGAMRVLYAGDPPPKLSSGLWSYRADWRRVVVGGALSNGGVLRDWMVALFAPEALAEANEDALAAMEPDAHGLTILPFWAGERSTGWSAHARGAILGLTTSTRANDLLRAAMEAIAYRFALIADALPVEMRASEIVASGGALRASPVWAQILADAIGRPLTMTDAREASSRGAALLALEAMGEIKEIADFPIVRGARYEPNLENHARYRAAMRRQKILYDLLTGDEEIARLIARES